MSSRPPASEALLRDLRYAVRMLRKTPGFTAVALLTLTVGIGVNTAVFTVVNALLLEPLPYPSPERLATIRITTHGPAGEASRDMAVDGATFLSLRDEATLIDVAASGSDGWGGGVNLADGGRAANVSHRRVSAGYFSVLGVAPLYGREFSRDDDLTGSRPVAILGHGLWTRHFGGDPAVLDRTILLRGEPHTVVGIMPAGFEPGTPVDVWTPLRPSRSGEGGGTNYSLIARIEPGVAWDAASAEVDRIATPAMRTQLGRFADGASSSLVPLQAATTAGVRDALLLLWAGVGVVLAIVCVNVAGLLLARGSARSREIATRLALGGGRAALVRQLLVESAVLGLVGTVCGALFGWLALDVLIALGADAFVGGAPLRLTRASSPSRLQRPSSPVSSSASSPRCTRRVWTC